MIIARSRGNKHFASELAINICFFFLGILCSTECPYADGQQFVTSVGEVSPPDNHPIYIYLIQELMALTGVSHRLQQEA